MSTTVKILTDKAVEAALHQNWPDAIEFNLDILNLEPADIPTLNRLAKAYQESGEITKAINICERVLLLDRFNTIAQKNLVRLSQHNHLQTPCSDKIFDTNFIEEPGKTRTIPLVRLGDPALVTNLQPGEVVSLVPRNHGILVTTPDGHHIGALTDDVAFTLKQLIAKGNCFRATVKSVTPKTITIFVREANRL